MTTMPTELVPVGRKVCVVATGPPCVTVMADRPRPGLALGKMPTPGTLMLVGGMLTIGRPPAALLLMLMLGFAPRSASPPDGEGVKREDGTCTSTVPTVLVPVGSKTLVSGESPEKGAVTVVNGTPGGRVS